MLLFEEKKYRKRRLLDIVLLLFLAAGLMAFMLLAEQLLLAVVCSAIPLLFVYKVSRPLLIEIDAAEIRYKWDWLNLPYHTILLSEIRSCELKNVSAIIHTSKIKTYTTQLPQMALIIRLREGSTVRLGVKNVLGIEAIIRDLN